MSSQVQAKEIPAIEEQKAHREQLTIFFILHAFLYQSFPISSACCEDAFPSACKKIRICNTKEVQVFIEMKNAWFTDLVKYGSKIPCGVQQSGTVLPIPRVACSCNALVALSHIPGDPWSNSSLCI